MRSLLIAIVGCTPLACGDDTCSRNDRLGTFLFDALELSGNCGPIPREDVTIRSHNDLPAGCNFDAPDLWSSDECSLTRRYTCVQNGTTYHFEGHTEQWTDDPDYVFGTAVVKAFDADGNPVCESVYDVEWTRK